MKEKAALVKELKLQLKLAKQELRDACDLLHQGIQQEVKSSASEGSP